MDVLPWSSIACYSAFGIFFLPASACTDNGWQKLMVTAQSFAGMLTESVYLEYCSWKTAWWMPVILLVMSALAAIPANLIERLAGWRQARSTC